MADLDPRQLCVEMTVQPHEPQPQQRYCLPREGSAATWTAATAALSARLLDTVAS